MAMSTRGQRLREARQKWFKTAMAAAEAMDIPNSTYNAHEHAQEPKGRDYTPEQAIRYARRFQNSSPVPVGG